MSVSADMRFVKNYTPPDFQAKNFTPLYLPNFNSFGDKNTKKMSENGDIYTVSKKFTLTPAVTAVTNLTSVAVVNVDDRLVTAWHNFYNSFSKLSYIYSYSCWSKLRVLAFS